MVHLLFFCFAWGSLRGLSTALIGCLVSHHVREPETGGWLSPDGLIKNSLEIPLCEGGAFKVLDGLDLLGADERLLVCHGCHPLLGQAPDCIGVLAQIKLGADQNDGDVGCVVVNLGIPLLSQPSSVSKLSSPAGFGTAPTLALTLSNDGGLTMEKQMRKTSV